MPTSSPNGVAGIEVVRAETLEDALALAGITDLEPGLLAGYGITMRETGPSPVGRTSAAEVFSMMVPEESADQWRR